MIIYLHFIVFSSHETYNYHVDMSVHADIYCNEGDTMLKYLTIYASETGNTKRLAEEIHNSLPCRPKEKMIVDVRSWHGDVDAENYLVGFWANRGSCTLEIIDLLSSIHNKNVALFGTCGMGNNKDYFEALEQNARVWLPEDNRYLGSYFCQGKMPPEIRVKYEAFRGRCNDGKLDYILSRFDVAQKHPDKKDFLEARFFVDKIVIRIKKLQQVLV